VSKAPSAQDSDASTVAPSDKTDTPVPTEQPSIKTLVPNKTPTLDMQASDTPAPAISGGGTTPVPTLSLAVDFQPTNLIVAATSAAAQAMNIATSVLWLLSFPCLLLALFM
jgi:hypothetical protein